MAVLAIRLPGLLEDEGFKINGVHATVMDIVSSGFDMPKETLFVVFDHVSDEEIENTLNRIEKLKLTSAIESPLENTYFKSGEIAYAMLHFDDEVNHMPQGVTDIREAIGEKEANRKV